MSHEEKWRPKKEASRQKDEVGFEVQTRNKENQENGCDRNRKHKKGY